jgi:hypothetical protein
MTLVILAGTAIALFGVLGPASTCPCAAAWCCSS